MLRGIDEYMQEVEGALTGPPDPVDWKLSDFDVVFVAVVNFVADIVIPGRAPRPFFRIMDIYTKQADGHWIQSASHTVRHPEDIARRMEESAEIPDGMRDKLLADRDAVWRAWFANTRRRELRARRGLRPHSRPPRVMLGVGRADFQGSPSLVR